MAVMMAVYFILRLVFLLNCMNSKLKFVVFF